MAGNRLRIGVVTYADPWDARSWSGICAHMLAALERQGAEVHALGPASGLPRTVFLWSSRFGRVVRRLTGRTYLVDRSIAYSWACGLFFHRRLRDAHVDCLLAPGSAVETAFLSTDVPIIPFGDATLSALHDYYPSYSNLSPLTVLEGSSVERRALRRSAALVYASQWAAASASELSGIPVSAMHVLPMGANIAEGEPAVTSDERQWRGGVCRLLFLGLDWERKGGPIVLEAAERLRADGVPTEVIVCGCQPPERYGSDWIRVVPPVNKSTREGRVRFDELLRDSTFLFVPTRADCYGIVFAEASARGLPIIATDTGGVSAAVREGINGCLLPLEAEGSDYAALIRSILEDPEEYRRLSIGARRLYLSELNWDTWARKFLEIAGRCVGGRPEAAPE